MSERTIMIFPEFANMAVIDSIRRRYDPLAALVRPHITIAFPFDADFDDDELSAALEDALRGIAPFELALRGFSHCTDAFRHYLFLDVVQGVELLRIIHDRLYAGILRKFDLRLPYAPHMTVGKLPDANALDAAWQSVCGTEGEFRTVVRRVSVERIGPGGESIIILEKELQ